MELNVQAGADAGKTFKLDRPYLVVGRQVGNDIQINDSQISRRHLQLETRDGLTYVTDLNSANGTFINDRRLNPNQPEVLRSGDVLRLGDTVLAARGEPAASNTSEATQIGGAYSAQTQVVRPAPIPPNSNPSYNFPNSSPNSYQAGGYSAQNPSAGYTPQNPANDYSGQNPSGGYSGQNYAGGYAPQNQYQPGGYSSQPYANQQPSGYNPNYVQPSGYNSPNQPLNPPGYGTQAQPAVTRRGPNVGIIAIFAGIIIVAIIAVVIVLLLGNSHNSTNATATVQAAANATASTSKTAGATPTAGAIVLPTDTPAPANNGVPTVTPKPQAKATDTPKPQPTATPKPQPTATPKPQPTATPTKPATTTAAAATSAAPTGGFVLGDPDTPVPGNGGSGGSTTTTTSAKTTPAGNATAGATSGSGGNLTAVNGLGVTISFPSDWQHEVNTDKNYILGQAPDNVTYVELVKSDQLTGSVSDRLNSVLDSVKKDSPDLKIVQQVKTSSDNSTASVQYTYTDTQDNNTPRQETLICVENPDDDTISYIIVFSAAKSKYSSEESTFNDIAKTFDFTS